MTAMAPRLQIGFLLLWVVLCSFFFANVEIQIEGEQGWAAGLPCWRVENHWLLDIFWGGRALTGYHAWCFSFMALVFHLPIFMGGKFSWQLEARIISCLMCFWIVEDFLWFVLNPAFGVAKFTPKHVPWHKSWILWFPTDYWLFAIVATVLFCLSFRKSQSTT